MCGIIAVLQKDKNPTRAIQKRYHMQKDRGNDGFGYVAIKDNKVVSIQRSEKDIFKKMEKEDANFIIFHHRYPTSTPNLKEMAHPIHIKSRTLKNEYLFLHNGIVSNDDELKEKHKKMRIPYSTEMKKKTEYKTKTNTYISQENYYNDSEAFSIEVALFLEKKQNSIEAIGSSAFIAIQYTNSTVKNIFFGRNTGNPLKYQTQKDFFCISSESGNNSVLVDEMYKISKTDVHNIEHYPVDIGKMRTIGYTGYNTEYDYWSSRLPSTQLNAPISTYYDNGDNKGDYNGDNKSYGNDHELQIEKLESDVEELENIIETCEAFIVDSRNNTNLVEELLKEKEDYNEKLKELKMELYNLLVLTANR